MSTANSKKARAWNASMKLGCLLLSLVLLFVLIGSVCYKVDPDKISPKYRLAPIGTEGHPLGTDHLGRDMLARLISGTRLSLLTSFITAVCATVIGITVGLIAGMSSKTVDIIIMRFIDLLQSFPSILLAILIVAFLGPSLRNSMIAIAAVNVPFFAVLTRSVTLSEKEKDYIKASYAIGNKAVYTTIHHILPNITGYLIAQIMMNMGRMLTVLTSLSFLGLGAQPPTPELGSMLGELRSVMMIAPAVVSIPGLIMVIAVMGYNFLGDGLRDYFDPKQ